MGDNIIAWHVVVEDELILLVKIGVKNSYRNVLSTIYYMSMIVTYN